MKYYFPIIVLIIIGLGYYYNKDYSLYLSKKSIMPHEENHMFYFKNSDEAKPKLAAIKNHDGFNSQELAEIQMKLQSADNIQLSANTEDIGELGEVYVTIWADGVKLN